MPFVVYFFKIDENIKKLCWFDFKEIPNWTMINREYKKVAVKCLMKGTSPKVVNISLSELTNVTKNI